MTRISIGKTIVLLLSALLLTLPTLSVINVSGLAPTTLRVNPPSLEVSIGSDFSADVNIDSFFDVFYFGIVLTYDPLSVAAVDVGVHSPFSLVYKEMGAGYMLVEGMGGPVTGSAKLAYFEFHCMEFGKSVLQMAEYYLQDPTGAPITVDEINHGSVTQTTWHWKAPYFDYAPSGVPDFDQRQDNWGKIDLGSGLWKWTWCGPTAVANSLWWMDSRFEVGANPPPAINDSFPLLSAYGAWDDHDQQNVQPFITDLGWYMDTDGNRTGYPWNGTNVHQMEKGISMYLRDRGLETEFVIKKMSKPNFYYIEEEIEKCEDVILLLGIWQSNNGITWWRVGGHYVTCAGVDSQNTMIAFSDPCANNAEAGGLGRVLPGPHLHPPPPVMPPEEDTVHNNAIIVSHDIYSVATTSPSPGGTFAVELYEPIYNPDFMQNIQGQNCPGEFKSQEGPWIPQAEFTAVEVEYSVIISPADWYFKPEQEDYAPSGVPDFDQKQWLTDINWTNPYPPVDTWSHCGPVAVANSLWWLDSEFEPNPIPPPTINDGFPLVQSYGPGEIDDHDPQNVPYLVENLAWYMDTNGIRTDTVHCGTEVHDMEYGIDWYLHDMGVDWKFYEHTEAAPNFFWIEDEIKRCEDVILLLGFWQNLGTEIEPYWVRSGGHYVTCAGVDSTNMMLAISDPFINNAEWGFPGRVIPPPPHPHTGPPETLHNNATYVSHDFYLVGPSPSPGGPFGLYQYPAEDIIDNFGSCQNFPREFLQYEGEYIPGLPIYTEIEYAVVVSCKTGVVAAGSEDGNVYVHDFNGNLQWTWFEEAYCVSVALDNEARYLAGGWRYSDYGILDFFDVNAVTDGGVNPPLWTKSLPISESYNGGWMGKESKSVDVKYSYYNQCYIVAAAHDYGLNLYDEWGNLIWQYFDEEGPETIVRISQDGNYIVCADYNSMILHYFSHLKDGVPGWGPKDGIPLWSFGGYMHEFAVYWTAISGLGDYVAVSGWTEPYPPGQPENTAAVLLLKGTGDVIWGYMLPKGGFVRVDMPCNGRSVVSVNDNPNDKHLGCDLLYFSDGGNGWDSGDGTPVWNYWPDKELGSPQNPLHDFYTVSISENGDYVATGGVPHNTYLLMNDGTLTQKVGLMPGAIQSVDLTFSGKYGASVDNAGALWFFSKDAGFLWSWANPYEAPFRCVAVSKIYPCMFPYPDHDVAVIRVDPWKTVVGKGKICKINVTVTNEGDFIETFNVTLFANATMIGSLKVNNLPNGMSINITFVWNTSGYEGSKFRYTISAVADIVQDETDTADNTCIDSIVKISCIGDINGDFVTNMLDYQLVKIAIPSTPGSPKWNPNADMDDNLVVNMLDYQIVKIHIPSVDP